MNLKINNKFALFFATGFFAGYFHFMPGTIGTIVGVIFYFIIKLFNNNYLYFLFILILFGIGWVTIESLEKYFGKKDPQQIVIDEIIGFLITMFLIPYTITNIILGFILFRIIDIIKPFPIRNIELLPGAQGVLFDDVLAGVYANLLLHGILMFS